MSYGWGDYPENKYVWSRCLTVVREESIESSDVRIFAGGKLEDYLGKMPGILEEFIIALDLGKPIYLIGGLGGLTKLLSESLLTGVIAKEFTEEWQITHNSEYLQLQKIAARHSHSVDYEVIGHAISELTIEQLSANTGLTKEEYIRMMKTPFVEESIYLILKGLEKYR